MNILITGGAGYIGSHITKLLLETTDHKIVIIDNLSTGSSQTIQTLKSLKDGGIKIDFYKEDLKNLNALESLFEANQFNVIIHLAASIVVPDSIQDPLSYYLNNTVNTANLIFFANKYKIESFIFSSTAAVYGEPSNPIVSEENVCQPINPYGMSKLMAETIIKDTAKANPNFKYVILRYFNVAGSSIDNTIGQSFPNATHLIKVAAECAVGKRPSMNIYGTDYPTKDGTCIRDYIHVDHLAMAHIKAIDYLKDNDSDIFNCGYGNGYSVHDVINTMKKISKNDFLVNQSYRRPGDTVELICDNTKIQKKLHWSPLYNNLTIICQTAFDWENKNLKTSRDYA